MLRYELSSPKYVALDEMSKVSLTSGTYIKPHCVTRLNISHKYYDFDFNIYRK